MSPILIHLDDDRLCSIEIDPESVTVENTSSDFPVAQAFRGTRSDIEGAMVNEDSRVAGLLDRLPAPGGEPIILSLSCGPTSAYALFRREGDNRQEVRVKVGDKAYLATELRLMDLLTETQRHFIVPNASTA
jgi:hypothetical protein